MNVIKTQGQKQAMPNGGKLRSQLSIDIFPVIPIGSLEQILDENWFPEYNHNHHDKAD